MKDNLTSGVWWKAAAIRALRTALVIAVPYLPVSLSGQIPYYTIGGAVGLGFVLSLLTSLAGIAEADGTKLNYWYALFERFVKTLAQAFVTGIGAALLLQDVNWGAITGVALASGLSSVVLGVIGTLPEADAPLAQVTIPTTVVINNAGETVESSLPAVATVSAGSSLVEGK